MKIISLFDGISCGHVALDRAGITVESYNAFEIEQSAIAITQHNYPSTVQGGDVFKADFTKLSGADIVIGGSPCTLWSICQKAGRRETTSDGFGFQLFSQYIRALRESNAPWFLYENNYSMDANICSEITKAFNKVMDERLANCDPSSEQYRAAKVYDRIVPILIDSATVSGQSRKRLYWTNIPKKCVPSDKGITLQSILEHGTVDREKGLCLARRYAGFQGTQSYLCRRYFGKSMGQAVFEGSIDEIKDMWKKDPRFVTPKEYVNIRPMTVTECERMQTLPDGYTGNVPGVNNCQRIEGIGNGWTVDVIAHLLRGFQREADGVEVAPFTIPNKFKRAVEEALQPPVHKYCDGEQLSFLDELLKA